MTALAGAIRALSGVNDMDNTVYVVCSVTSVNESSRSCNVTTISNQGEMTLEDVNLMAEDDDGFLMLPAVDSTVIVAYSDKVAPFVCFYSAIQAVSIVTENSGLDIRKDKIKFNDGSYGGLIKIADLVTRLNAVENALIEVKTMYNTHTHTGVTTGGGTSGTTPAVLTNTVTNTNRSQIENNLIQHGGSI